MTTRALPGLPFRVEAAVTLGSWRQRLRNMPGCKGQSSRKSLQEAPLDHRRGLGLIGRLWQQKYRYRGTRTRSPERWQHDDAESNERGDG